VAFKPFIVTAELPPDVFAWADGLRRVHFPAERNKLEAHVTLFHALAPSLRDELKPLLAQIATEWAPCPAEVTGLMDLGGGTALAIASPAMARLRAKVAEHFHGALTAQDNYPLKLHITVQNKVTREAAKALQTELSALKVSRRFLFAGLALHLYCGGPWQAVGRWKFRGKQEC